MSTHPQNTIQNFINTSGSDIQPIICPACGQPMSLKLPASYRRILVEKVRLNLDRHLQSFARSIEQLENDLQIYNTLGPGGYDQGKYPFDRELQSYKGLESFGYYSNSYAYKAANQYTQECDPFEHREFIFSREISSSFPLTTAMEGGSGTTMISTLDKRIQNGDKIQYSILDFLLRGFERASLIGILIDLVLSQDEMLKWATPLLKCKNPEDFKKINNIVRELTPNIYIYLNKIFEDIQEPESIKKFENSDNDPRYLDKSEEAIKRVKLIIALLLGYQSEHVNDLDVTFVKYGQRFSLPKITEVKIHILPELMTSHIILKQCNINWDPKLVQYLSYNENISADQGDSDKKILDLLGLWKTEIKKMFNFSCTGPSGHFYDPAKKQQYKDLCNWYPKEKPTHPIIFLGSPGTGKTTAMKTGIANIRQAVAAIGCTMEFNTPEGQKFLDKKRKESNEGTESPPTKAGERFSVDILVEPTEKKSDGTYGEVFNFIFTDIPGETVNKLFNEEGADSVLLGILENAETIVMFYDLSVDPDFRSFMTDSAREDVQKTWSRLIHSFKKVSEARDEKDKNGNAKPGTGAEKVNISQTELLNKLIKALHGDGYEHAPNKPKQNFICVITKADLYADFGSESPDWKADKHTLFMSDFFLEMKKHGLLIDPTGKDDGLEEYPNNFTIYQSYAGGVLLDDNKPDTNKSDLMIKKQWDVIKSINSEAQKALTNIKNATSLSETSSQDLKRAGLALETNIRVGLRNKLTKVFGNENVYYLPASPAGSERSEENHTSSSEGNKSDSPAGSERSEKDNTSSSKGTAPEPFRQKLSEYIFLLPMMLSLGDKSEETPKQPETEGNAPAS